MSRKRKRADVGRPLDISLTRSSGRLRLVLAMVVAGVLLILSGALWIGSYSMQRPPGPDIQIYSPQLTLYSDTAFARATAILDLRGGLSFNITIAPGSQESFGSPERQRMDQPTVFYLLVRNLAPIQWHVSSGVVALKIVNSTEMGIRTALLDDEEGSSSVGLFRFKLEPDSPPATLYFEAQGPAWWSSGGTFIPNLPSLTVAPSKDSPISEEEANSVDGEAERLFASTQIDEATVYPPSLRILASVTPYEQLNADLDVASLSPTPTFSPPMHFEIDSKFMPYFLYRDTGWLRAQSLANLLGGILIGLGSGSVLAPTALLFSEDRGRRASARSKG